MTAIESLAEFVASVRVSEVPPAVLDTLRLHVFDTLAASLIGGATAEGQALAALVADTGGDGTAPAVGLGVRAAPPLAALAACAATRCTEVDDIHLESCTTPGAVVVPAALALAHGTPPADADAFLAAALAGYEALTRFGRAVAGPTILYRGVWPTYLASGIGAAALAARLLGLGSEDTAHALAAALTMATGTTGRSRPPASRWLTLGGAVQNGMLAALAARRGFRGDLTLLEGGWSRVTGIALDTESLLAGLGDRFAIQRVSVKPYCSAKQATGPIAALLAVLDEVGVTPVQAERVVVEVPRAYATMIDQPAPPTDRLASILSVQYQLALAAFHRDELRDVLRPALHAEPAFQAFMGKVQVVADERLAEHYPAAWPARVTVQTAGGAVRREVRHTWGDPGQPFTWDDARAKAERVLRGVTPAATVNRLAAVCEGLGRPATLADLYAAIPRATAAP
jgi:2-methylcitrate dehydratase PrpD